jgi:uncharacterized protein YcfL
MRKHVLAVLCIVMLAGMMLTGCSSAQPQTVIQTQVVEKTVIQTQEVEVVKEVIKEVVAPPPACSGALHPTGTRSTAAAIQ